MKRLILMTAVALTLSAGAVQAADPKPADVADMQCLALAAYLGGQAEEGSEMQVGLVGGMMYYLGRLDGRTPGVDWLAQLGEYLMSADETELQEAAPRCGAEMQAKGQALIDWGDSFQATVK